MKFLKYILPVAAVSASIYAIYRYFFQNDFFPGLGYEEDRNFQLYKCKNISYLWENNLPYPTYYSSVSNPFFSLDGQWLMRVDRDGRGIGERWFDADFQAFNCRGAEVPGCFNTFNSPLRDYVGAVWYQKKFSLSSEFAESIKSGHFPRLNFGGSAFKTMVWLNGRYLGESHDGYMPFYFKISDALLADKENVITVMVSNDLDYNSVPPKHYENFRLGWHQYGGMHKSVKLEALPGFYCFKVNPVTSFSGRTGTVKVRLLLHNIAKGVGANGAAGDSDGKKKKGKESRREVAVQLIIKAPGGKKCAEGATTVKFGDNSSVAAAVETLKISNPKLWDAEAPNLYMLTVKTPYEEISLNFGFRSIGIEDCRIKINDNETIFKGISRHEENVPDGLAQKKDSIEEEMGLIKGCGGNYARLAHYPHSPEALEYSDREGLYVWTEIPLYQAGVGFFKIMLQKTRADKEKNMLKNLPATFARMNQLTDPCLLMNARKSMLKLVERHLNHPSIIFWGVGNECWSFNPAGEKALNFLKEQVQSLDRSRLVSYAALCIPVITELFERSFNVVDVIAVNEYHGWYYKKTEDAETFLENIHRKYPEKPILISETGSDCAYGEHDISPAPERGYSEEYQRNLLKTKWETLTQKPWFAGWSIWVLKDFLCMEYLEDNPVPYFNLKGLIDRNYRQKLSYHLLKTLYSK